MADAATENKLRAPATARRTMQQQRQTQRQKTKRAAGSKSRSSGTPNNAERQKTVQAKILSKTLDNVRGARCAEQKFVNLRCVEQNFVNLRCVEQKFVNLRCVEQKFVNLRCVGQKIRQLLLLALRRQKNRKIPKSTSSDPLGAGPAEWKPQRQFAAETTF